jgi:two-component system phosphate regulon response regulator PhoB
MQRILVINDEDDLLFVYRLALEHAGYTVETTTDAEGSVEIAKRFRADLITLDWVMPRMNGERVLRALRQAPQTRDLPILVMSALQSIGDYVRRLGADAFLAKPFTCNELLASVRDLSERSQRAPRGRADAASRDR